MALLPLGYLLLRLSDGLDAAATELIRPRTLELLVNTLVLVVSVAASALAIGLFQAWFLVRTKIPFAGFFAILATIPLAIPSYVLALGYISILPWFSGFWASWLVLSVATAPFVFLAVSASLMRIDVSAEEVARSLGLNRWQLFWKVTWPQIRTSATASTLLVALYVLGEFGAIALLRFDTFTRAIYNAYRSSFDRTAAASLAIVLVLLTLVILYFERRYRGDYLKLRPANSKRILDKTPLRTLVVVTLGLIGMLAAVLPVVALTNWTLIGSSRLELASLFNAILNSFYISAAASLVIGIFALGSAVWFIFHKDKLAKAAETIIWSNHALPAIVVGLSLVFFGANVASPIYQTIWLLLIGYLILFLPNALVAVSTPLSQVPSAVSEVSRSLGKSYRTTMRKIILPIASPGLLAAVALVMLTVIKELPLTLLLRPTGVETLATQMWQATEELAYSQAAPYALALVIIAGLPALALNASVRRTYSEVSNQ